MKKETKEHLMTPPLEPIPYRGEKATPENRGTAAFVRYLIEKSFDGLVKGMKHPPSPTSPWLRPEFKNCGSFATVHFILPNSEFSRPIVKKLDFIATPRFF